MVRLSREDLYALVWERPMRTLAKEFGLSDVALLKICRKHDVPNPPPGWWAKKAAGKKVTVTTLPKLRDGICERIVIAGGELRREPEVLAVARETARVFASSSAPDERATNPIIERTVAKLRKGKPGPTGLVSTDVANLIKCEIAPASLDRVQTVLERIAAAAGQQGFELRAGDQGACFASGEKSVGFSITESYRRVKHELTEKERAQDEKWQRKRERSRARGDWDSISILDQPHFPEWDYHPTGLLSFELEYFYGAGSPRRTFRDGKVQRLEEMAGDIAVGIVVLAAAKTEARLQREAEQRRQEEQRRLREQAMRAQHVEERRAAALAGLLDDIAEAKRLRALLDHVETGGADDPRVAEFIRWTEDRLARKQAAIAAEALAARFADERLFGDDDEHAFRPPHYY